MRDEAERRIGHLYPKAKLPPEYGGGEATVIAWLWARTVTCPNPACGAQMPLVRSFWLATKKGKEAWLEPVIDQAAKTVRYEVRSGEGKPQEGTVKRSGADCIVCGTPVPLDHIRTEGQAGRMGAQMMAIVAEGHRGRIYLPPDEAHEAIAEQAQPSWKPDTDLPVQALGFRVQLYGMTQHARLFTPRQLVALTTFSDLVGEARTQVQQDAAAAGAADPQGYADTVAVYLVLSISKAADLASALCHWQPNPEHLKIAPTFARHALPMSWDFAEGNPFSDSSGNFSRQWELVEKVLNNFITCSAGKVYQHDATISTGIVKPFLFSTDPPYYDNVPYADLSDFFYVWLKRPLARIYPDIFDTLLVPKPQ
jgi:putative DNA methylase